MKIILIVFVFFSFHSYAEVKIVEDSEYYTVIAKSKKELLPSLNSASPIREDGNTFHGHTKYDIDWRFWWKSKNNQCRLTKVETTLSLKYTLPKLKSSKDSVSSVWSKWYPNLIEHEKGHGNLAKNTVHEIDKKLLSIGPRVNCKVLEQDANKLGYKLMDSLKKANKKYDVKTNHGETEGAWLYTHL